MTNTIRFDGGHGTIVGAWGSGGTPMAPVGFRISMTADSAAVRIRRTGRPARIDSYDDQPGELFATLREVGLPASVGAPVVVDGELWGAVIVATVTLEPFPPGAEHRLAEFAELMAQALANADAREQLAASRRRLVEAAAYFVAAEALTNVARYASATAASVTVGREGGGVLLEVESPPGRGTRVRAWLPDR